MSRHRLLAISAVAPWPLRGGFSLRAAHLLERLASDRDIRLVVGAAQDPEAVPWAKDGRHVVVSAGLADPPAAVPGRTARAALRTTVQPLLDSWAPDAALLFPGTEFLAFGSGDFPPTVADRIDCGTLERFRYIRRARYLRPLKAIGETVTHALYERRLARESAVTTVVGDDDARAIRRMAGNAGRVEIVPNGVIVRDDTAFDRESATPTVAITGTLSYYANLDAVRWFLRDMWPAIRARVPEARLIVAGRGPSRGIRALDGADGIEVRADVPDMFDVLQEAWVAVAPFRCGAGVKNKVLEAWAAGRPVVMTPMATNGVELDDRQRKLVADEPVRLSDLVVDLLADRDRRHGFGAAAQSLVRERHSWDRSAALMGALLNELRG